jgi:hypothetical protein
VLRTDNLRVDRPSRTVTVRDGEQATIEWRGRRSTGNASWTAVATEDGDVRRRREVFGW